MEGWNGWLTPEGKNEGRKGRGNRDRIDFLGFDECTGLGGRPGFQNIYDGFTKKNKNVLKGSVALAKS